jgi:isopentenyl-diphosphate delta-isomerase
VATIEQRKLDHLEIASSAAGQTTRSAGFEDVHLVPASLPELALDEVDLTTPLLGCRLSAPVMVAGMTGGHPAAREINGVLGEVAGALGIAVGVGSQRAALVRPELADTYSVMRERGPGAFIVANVGVAQLVEQPGSAVLGSAELERAVEMVGAQALALHINIVEEMVQTEGDRNAGGLLRAIERATGACSVPVIAKETGAGLVGESGAALVRAGVAALDVGGAGGTSFALVEAARAERAGDRRGARLGRAFGGWGVPTTCAILENRSHGVAVIATGGVRSGLDVVKALSLGADVVAVGKPAIQAALDGPDALAEWLTALIEEVRVALLLCGCRTPAELRNRPPVVTGFTREWAVQRRLSRGWVPW